MKVLLELIDMILSGLLKMIYLMLIYLIIELVHLVKELAMIAILTFRFNSANIKIRCHK